MKIFSIRLLRRAYALLAMTSFLAIATTPADARICERDWLSVWRNANGELHGTTWLEGNGIAYNRGSQTGAWAVTANQNNTGYQTVNGMSNCTSSAATSPWVISTDGANCWCKMTGPRVGLWVFAFTYSTTANCANGCARHCAYCAQHGAQNSCTRAALLALP